MRVRRVVGRSGTGIRGKFPSRKLNRSVHYESMLERDAILLLEYNPLVLSYQEQPSVEIFYDVDQSPRKYIPDFCVELVGGGRLVVEIKPASQLQRRKVHQKFQAIALRFKEAGRAFRVLTEADIRKQPRFDNLQLLHDSTKSRSCQEDFQALSAAFDGSGLRSFGELCEAVGGEGPVLRQIAEGRLRTDLNEPLVESAAVWPATNVEAGHGAFHI